MSIPSIMAILITMIWGNTKNNNLKPNLEEKYYNNLGFR